MQNVNWGSFRIALYSIVGGIVAALGAWGIIAESQVDSITQAVTAVLGALIDQPLVDHALQGLTRGRVRPVQRGGNAVVQLARTAGAVAP